MRLKAVMTVLAGVASLSAMSFASTYGPRSTASPVAGRSQERPTLNDNTLYSNGSDDGIVGYTINYGYVVTNSFTLSANSSLTSATFSNWLIPGDAALTVDWAITSAPFGGSTLGSGTASLTGLDQGINGFGYDVVDQTFSLGGLQLAAGTYYLQLGNIAVADGDPAYWGESGGPSFACQSGNGLDCTPIGSEAFQISGGTATGGVPEPGSLVLLTTGMLGAGNMLRRKWLR